MTIKTKRRKIFLTLAVTASLSLVSSLLFTPAEGQEKKSEVSLKPAAHIEKRIEGWNIELDSRLEAGAGKALGDRALRLLETQLRTIVLILPEEKVKRLQKVTIWLDQTHGLLRSPQYHPSAEWLKENGYSAALVKCVHLPDAIYFSSVRFQRDQPFAVLHELAHAYHDQVLGFDDTEIKNAWEGFVKSGKYRSVLHIEGGKTAHYALTNEKEFFAEMTETYFGMNDFYPFNRAELKQEEPELSKLMERVWGKPGE